MEEVRISLTDSLAGHQDRVWCVAWNPKGTILASCGGDKTVRLWAKEDERWICKMVLDGSHKRTVRRVAWSPCGQQIASASFDGTTCVWSQKSGVFECVATLEGHENEVKSVTWSAGGNLLATCSRDKSVWIWEVDEESDDFECASVITSHSQDVKNVKWHPTEDILASVSYDNAVKLYKEEADDWSCFATLDSHTSTVWGLDFNASGSRLVTCSDDRTLKIWEQDEHRVWKCVCTITGYHDRPIYDVSWCRLTGLIASAGGDDSLRIFGEGDPAGGATDPHQAPTFNCLTTLPRAHEEELNSVSWNPAHPGLLATASDDGLVKLWTVKSSNTDSH